MSAKLNPSRYAHCEGHTGVCFSQDASYIITCGGEGDIRIWTGIEDDEATDKCVGEKAFAVCQSGEKLYVGTDKNNVQILTFPEPDLDGVLARFTAPVTDIDASADGSVIVSSSCDMTIGVTHVNESTTDTIKGHRAAVLSVVLDPKLEYFVSSSCDGFIKVWHLSEKKEVVSWDCVPKSNSWQHSVLLGRSSWLPKTGALLAIPFRSEVRIFHRDSWEKANTFSVTSLETQLFSVVKFSACGQYLAASTTNGHIVIWNVNTQSLTACLQTDEKEHICALDWNPQLLQIAFCDTNGNFGTVDMQTSTDQEESKARIDNFPVVDPDIGDADDEDNENVISLEKIKNESGFLADGLLDDDDKASVKDEEDGRSSRLSDNKTVAVIPPIELQPPFQPSSTPVSLQYRFMVWNDIGIVKQTNTEDESAIDVEFHDTNHHHSFRVNNIAGHTLAALSADALVLACEAIEDTPSKIVCIMLNAWDGSKEWTTILPEEEEALCVAAGKGFVAVATDTRMLRLFTTCGTQREVLCLSGPVVCLAAHDHTLAVVYHSGTGLNGDQCLSYMEVWLGSSETLVRPCAPRSLPMSPRARLRWLGYSDEGSLCALDMAGLLRKLTPSYIWTPICDVDKLCKGKSDHHFVVGVSESFQTIRSVLCKGAFYPPTMPRPTATEISWQVPLCEASVEKGELEEQFWRCNVVIPTLQDDTTRDTVDKTIKKTLLKLFALACQSGLEMRAVGLCQLMSSEVVELAVKYASKLGRLQLAERIAETTSQRPPSPPHRTYDNSFQELQRIGGPEPESHNYALSQDMFASSTEDQHLDQDNPILALKQRLSGVSSTTLQGSLKRSNPFKKSLEERDDSDKGLAGLVKQATAKQAAKPAAVRPPVKQPPKKSTTNENKPKKNAFMDWFSSHKEGLEEEFPELDTTELTKVALKRYKEEQKPKPNNSSVKKFFGTKNSNAENTKKEDSSSPANSDSEIKKRKTPDEELPELPQAKKSSVASKLKMFSFVKP